MCTGSEAHPNAACLVRERCALLPTGQTRSREASQSSETGSRRLSPPRVLEDRELPNRLVHRFIHSSEWLSHALRVAQDVPTVPCVPVGRRSLTPLRRERIVCP